MMDKFNLEIRIQFAKMDRENDNEEHNSHSSQSSPKSTGPSSPAPSISCGTCAHAQLSELEIKAFDAVKEVAPYVRSINVSQILPRSSELLFLNVVTLENEPYCIELTKKGWRVCSERLDCMHGDYRKLELHVPYYETIHALLTAIVPGIEMNTGEE